MNDGPIKPGETRQFLEGPNIPTIDDHVNNGRRAHPVIIIDAGAGIMTVEYGSGQGYTSEAVTDEARHVLSEIENVLGMFLEKNMKYAKVQTGHDLGVQGIIPDLNRKVGILVDRIWHGNNSPGESSREVVMDLIGHLFLMLYKMEEEDGRR